MTFDITRTPEFEEALKLNVFDQVIEKLNLNKEQYPDIYQACERKWEELHPVLDKDGNKVMTYHEKIVDALNPEQRKIYEQKGIPTFYNDELNGRTDLIGDPPLISPMFAFRGKNIVVFAREKQGKSTILAHDAIECGKKGHKVLWMSAEEDIAGIRERFNDYVNNDFQDDSEVSRIPVQFTAFHPKDFQEIRNTIRLQNPDYVIIDSLLSIFPAVVKGSGITGGLDKTHEWLEVVKKFNKLAVEYDCAMLMIHHANKGNGEYMGSAGIGQACDGILKFERIPEDEKTLGKPKHKKGKQPTKHDVMLNMPNVTAIHTDKCRFLDGDILYVQYDPTTRKVKELPDVELIAPDSLRLFNILKDKPLTAEVLLRKLRLIGVSKYRFYKAKEELKIADIDKGGKYEIPADCKFYDIVKQVDELHPGQDRSLIVKDGKLIGTPETIQSKDLVSNDRVNMTSAAEVVRKISNES